MWFYNSPVGKIKIYFNDTSQNYALNINGFVYGFYSTPNKAAGDVYTHTTGCTEWDMCEELTPETVDEWERA